MMLDARRAEIMELAQAMARLGEGKDKGVVISALVAVVASSIYNCYGSDADRWDGFKQFSVRVPPAIKAVMTGQKARARN